VVSADQPDEIIAAARELLVAILDANPTLNTADIASALFTVTDDLRSAFPAEAARELGWHQVPLMCAREIPVPGSQPRCIRVLIHWNTELEQHEIHPAYLGEAASLRTDFVAL
jgi:chorismate mutase